ncbi:MAG: anthranilate phosphoribosyltransferase [Candidatus Marinimicrobia bacterium]|jgi:anthranilate phosphoribosyltransferase|nr:anthranilate phosphoribosyltransferase [Candidatus Neomarinimicrobiota bacterium]MBT3633158.1 anthranilate phosphoribosyltransferase [Candidatus Neomarinimicrobiota bacterium]MBT3682241.1 anthranilate phosphoribosyltransferase [Candidatus Neomarinimicrobiota bacterium]MBT3758758.1 anthranilate phosphoribosyltransferase [Candidatus Neomarinimicrobiota bacterium]MBT3895368.1 anthranilate phosphoribosyltransferase [Candidatus Neomarinimicrobiota bacterium]
MKTTIDKLLGNQSLNQDESREIMFKIMSGEFNDVQIAGFLIALRSKGESSSEIAGFTQAMREKMTSVPIQSDAIDMCGTGGDARGTFNISTAASFVVAGAGVKVAKHGNRSMTSKSGSADVLTALGVDITMSPEKVAECVDEIGIGFMFAPYLHPAMKYAVKARTSLGVRTVFNILGPLANPAGVRRQVLGVYDGVLTVTLAKVLKRLNAVSAMVVHGHDGMDEITNTSSTKVTKLENGSIKSTVFSPADYGIAVAKLGDLAGGEPEENAKIIIDIFRGETGPRRDIVLLNAAAGIVVGGKVEYLSKGIELARQSIDSGSAYDVMQKLISKR